MKRQRTATESLLSIMLVLEAIVVFFVTLTAFGLRAVEPVPAFVGGAALIVVLVLAGRVVRFAWGLGLAWVLQGVIVATGILLPVMYFVGAGFVGLFVYFFFKGRQLDRAKAAYLSTQAEEPHDSH